MSRIFASGLRFHRRCARGIPRVLTSAPAIPKNTIHTLRKYFATAQQRRLPNRTVPTRASAKTETKELDDAKVKISILAADDPGAQEALDFMSHEASKEISVHAGSPSTFLVTGKNIDDGRMVAACLGEIYDAKDICSSHDDADKAFEYSHCPTFARPHIQEIASVLLEHSPTRSKIIYGARISFAKEVRGGNLVAKISAESFRWALARGVSVFTNIAALPVASKFWFSIGYRPMGPMSLSQKLLSQNGPPRAGMAVPSALLVPDHSYLHQVDPGMAHQLKQMGTANTNALHALHNKFPLLASNDYSGAANLQKLQQAAASLEASASSIGNSFLWKALEPEDLAQMLEGAMEVAIEAGDSLELGRDISPKDCLLLLSGQVTTSAESDTRVLPGGIVCYGGREGSDAISEIVAVQDSHLLMLSSVGAKQFGCVLDEAATWKEWNSEDVAV